MAGLCDKYCHFTGKKTFYYRILIRGVEGIIYSDAKHIVKIGFYMLIFVQKIKVRCSNRTHQIPLFQQLLVELEITTLLDNLECYKYVACCNTPILYYSRNFQCMMLPDIT